MEEKTQKLEAISEELRRRIDDLLLRLTIREEREKVMTDRLESLKRDIDKELSLIRSDIKDMRKVINAVAWLIVSAVILGFVSFMLKGGLALV